jgi:hypothetical protein
MFFPILLALFCLDGYFIADMPRYVIEDNTVVAKRNLILNRTT